MKNLLLPNDLRGCRDIIKGRATSFAPHEHIVADYAKFRYEFKRKFAPLRGERLRKTVLGAIGTMTLLTAIYIMLAA